MNSRRALSLAIVCLQAASLLLVSALAQAGRGPSADLLPPLGNSAALVTVVIKNGARTFACSGGVWQLTESSAVLINASDPASGVVGTFLHTVGDEAGAVQWSVISSAADQTYTHLTGKQLEGSGEEYQLYLYHLIRLV